MQMFGSDGKLQLWKELDPQLHVSGPCLSKADYTAVSLNEALSSHVTIRGSRTDDVVRVFVDIRWAARLPCPAPAPAPRAPRPRPRPIPKPRPSSRPSPSPSPSPTPNTVIRLKALRDTTFSRLLFFQLSSETYSSAPAHERFAWGGNGAATTRLPRTCSPTHSGGRYLRKHLYAASGIDTPFRAAMNGDPERP